jgi:hypothetical protein
MVHSLVETFFLLLRSIVFNLPTKQYSIELVNKRMYYSHLIFQLWHVRRQFPPKKMCLDVTKLTSGIEYLIDHLWTSYVPIYYIVHHAICFPFLFGNFLMHLIYRINCMVTFTYLILYLHPFPFLSFVIFSIDALMCLKVIETNLNMVSFKVLYLHKNSIVAIVTH